MECKRHRNYICIHQNTVHVIHMLVIHVYCDPLYLFYIWQLINSLVFIRRLISILFGNWCFSGQKDFFVTSFLWIRKLIAFPILAVTRYTKDKLEKACQPPHACLSPWDALFISMLGLYKVPEFQVRGSQLFL